MPESIGDVFMVTSLLESIKKTYPEHSIYLATKQENFPILDCNPNVKRVIPFIPQMDSLIWLEGQWSHKGFFDIAFLPHAGTQKFLDYVHNGSDKIQFDIQCTS
jgi:hypothetical protein